MQTITVTISPDASVRVETTGFVGKACKDATAALESALGVVSSDASKPEYHQQEVRRVAH